MERLLIAFKQQCAQQFNGREGETATLLWKLSVKFKVVAGGFAPRHLSRWAAQLNDYELYGGNP